MASILIALKKEDTRRSNAVFDEELSLELALWEIFKENSWADLLRKHFDQSSGYSLIILITKFVFLNEIIEVNKLHVGSFAESSSKGGLSRGLWSNDARDLWKHGFAGVFIDFKRISVRVNVSNLSKSAVEVSHRF